MQKLLQRILKVSLHVELISQSWNKKGKRKSLEKTKNSKIEFMNFHVFQKKFWQAKEQYL